MRSVPYLAYVVCGLALGVVLYLCWRANARGGVDSEQEESFVSPISLDPPRAPCNVDFGSLVQDQFLAENSNQGSNKCQHQYPDPTVFGGEIRMQQSPNRFVFCTSKAASQLDKCPAECTGGGCISLQSEADNITNATRKKTNQFIKSLNQFEDLQFGPMRNLFDGVSLPPASEYAEEVQTEGVTLIPGVYPTLKAELARREKLIREMDSLQTDIQTAADAITKVTPHVNAQETCLKTHEALYTDIAANTTTVDGRTPQAIPGGGGGGGYSCYGNLKAVLYEIPGDEECGVCGDDSNLCKNVGKSDPDSDYSHIDSSALEKENYRISATPFSKELCNAANYRTRMDTKSYAIVDNARLLSK